MTEKLAQKLKENKMKSIAITIPVCSRNQNYNSIDEIPFLNRFYKSFQITKENKYRYEIFLGYDEDDHFYKKNIHILLPITENIFELSGCQHAPAWAWNQLASEAYKQNFDYVFQIGDDVNINSEKWTSQFIERLLRNDNIGVVGPCNLKNIMARELTGKMPVIENAFVHRTHLDIFKYFFHPSIRNWYCDDWLTRVYQQEISEIQRNIICENSIVSGRYNVEQVGNLDQYVEEGIEKIRSYKIRS